MGLTFKKATKTQSKLRLSIAGPSGSGKTYSALRIATEMGGKIAFIDTERGSASKYSDVFDFDVIELEDFHPERYIEAIKAAESAGYDILIIDSTTHEWNGKGGILEIHEAEVARQRTKNSFTAWAAVTPLHNRFIDSILQSKCHVITTVRSKVDYLQDKDDRGKATVTKVGMASIQREGMDYEYDIMMEMNLEHIGNITKTRCAALDGRSWKKPGAEIAEILNAWLSDGAPAPVRIDDTIQKASDEEIALYDSMLNVWIGMGKPREEWIPYCKKHIYGKSVTKLKSILADWQTVAAKRAAENPVTTTAEAEEVSGCLPDDLLASIEREKNTLRLELVQENEIQEKVMKITSGEVLEDCTAEVLGDVLLYLQNWAEKLKPLTKTA